MALQNDPRFALLAVIRMMLARQDLWPADGRAAGLRSDMEQLFEGIEVIEPDEANRYMVALGMILANMPSKKPMERGFLKRLADAESELEGIRTAHPDWNEEQVFLCWKEAHQAAAGDRKGH